MMLRFAHHNIMKQNTKLSGQPIICQLFSFIPEEILRQAVSEHKSDHYYKTLTTKKQLAFLLYGVVTKCNSLNSLCKNLLFLENKLMYIGIDKLPAVSTLSDANINRCSDVFGKIYFLLYHHYCASLSDSYNSFFYTTEIDTSKVILFDATTISMFVDVFKGAGRNPINGKKKGGLKIQATMPLTGSAPDVIHLQPAAMNDKTFLGQLNHPKGTIYVFDKGYVNYRIYEQWSQNGIFYVTRINDNASYTILEQTTADIADYAGGGVIRDEIILLNIPTEKTQHKARLITYKDPLTGNVLQFISNIFDCTAQTIALLYKCRWNMEVLFKQLKQNFELSYFYSDSKEGIKTQIWIALIANLLFTVIHKRIKESEQFITLVNMTSNNMGSYICLITLFKSKKLTSLERNLEIVQLELYEIIRGGVFQNKENST
jgi:hypothetical protein